MSIPFDITREEVLSLAAQKLVDAYCGDPDLSETAERMIHDKVEEAFATGMKQRIDEFLAAEMEKILGQEITPVTIWGEKQGQPTTIRAALSKRAKEFWEVSVNDEGRETTWGGCPRSEQLMKKVLKDEFANAIKANAEVIISEFKTAIKNDAVKMITEHIDRLISVKERR